MKRVGEIWEYVFPDKTMLFLIVLDESNVLQLFELESGKKMWISSCDVHEVKFVNGTQWRRMA